MTRECFISSALALVVITGCHSESARRQELGRRTGDLYEIYLNGTREDARRSIVEANRLIEQASFSDWEENRAFALFLGYGRLYSVDHRAGSNDLAQADLIKARYWALRSSEFHGDAASEADRYVEKFAGDGDKLLTFIDKWERGANHDKDPKYIIQP
jgi:hypothetical protein